MRGKPLAGRVSRIKIGRGVSRAQDNAPVQPGQPGRIGKGSDLAFIGTGGHGAAFSGGKRRRQQIIGQRRGLQSCGNGEAGPCLCRRGKRRRSEQYGADGQKRRYPACPSLHISSSLFAFSPIGRIW